MSMHPLEEVLSRLDHVRGDGDAFTARCPAHDDRNPSLSIGVGDDGRVLIHCFAGCSIEEIVDAIGLSIADLFPQESDGRRSRVRRS